MQNNFDERRYKLRNVPNIISLIRIILIPVFTTLFLLDGVFPFARTYATAVFLIAAITDFLDGNIARKYKIVTNLGSFLDSIADKMLVIAALVLIVFGDVTGIFAVYTMVASIIIICRELFISALRQIGAANNVLIHADKFGKVKAVVQLIALPFLLICSDIDPLIKKAGLDFELIMFIGFILFAIATIITIVSAIHYIIKHRQVFVQSNKKIDDDIVQKTEGDSQE